MDIQKAAGEELSRKLRSQSSSDRALFVHTDVSDWASLIETFQKGFSKFGHIDVVCANAGTNRWDDLFGEEFDASGVLKAPSTKLLEINLFGVIFAVKAAMHYFAKNPDGKGQLILTGSAASFFDTPPLYLYAASKGGILGMMRTLRTQLCRKNVTVNMIAPWMTKTPMNPQSLYDMWGDLPANDSQSVGKALLLPAVRHHINGKSLFVAGNNVFELEDGLERTRPQWMGEKLSAELDEGQRRLIPDSADSELVFGLVPKGA